MSLRNVAFAGEYKTQRRFCQERYLEEGVEKVHIVMPSS